MRWGIYTYTKRWWYQALDRPENSSPLPGPVDIAIQTFCGTAAAGGLWCGVVLLARLLLPVLPSSRAGTLGAIGGVWVTNPFDIARARMQTMAGGEVAAIGGVYANLRSLVTTEGTAAFHWWQVRFPPHAPIDRSLVSHTGWGGLTRGANVRIINALPFSISGILVYEAVKKLSVKPQL